jgi:hypothetical protein
VIDTPQIESFLKLTDEIKKLQKGIDLLTELFRNIKNYPEDLEERQNLIYKIQDYFSIDESE